MTLLSNASRICCLKLQHGQLQQADGLLQLRGHGQLLAESELQGGLEHSSRL